MLNASGGLQAEFPDLIKDPRGAGTFCAITFHQVATRDKAVIDTRNRGDRRNEVKYFNSIILNLELV